MGLGWFDEIANKRQGGFNSEVQSWYSVTFVLTDL
jgi:hypothetical protein